MDQSSGPQDRKVNQAFRKARLTSVVNGVGPEALAIGALLLGFVLLSVAWQSTPWKAGDVLHGEIISDFRAQSDSGSPWIVANIQLDTGETVQANLPVSRPTMDKRVTVCSQYRKFIVTQVRYTVCEDGG